MKRLLLALGLVILASAPAWAGMVVSDPTSYSYYVEQLKQQAKALEKMMDQIKEVQEVQNRITAVESQLTGSYSQAQGLFQDLKRIEQQLGRRATSAEAMAEKWTDLAKGIDGFIDSDELLDAIFKDPRNEDGSAYKNAEKHYEMRQDSLKKTVANCEDVLQGMPERLQRISFLSDKIDNTANIKEATDLGNRILVEILLVLNEQIYLAAQYRESQSLLDYHGIEVGAKKKHKYQEGYVNQGNKSTEQILQEHNIDSENMTTDDMKRLLGI